MDENGVPVVSGKHVRKSEKLDPDKILEQLLEAKVFIRTPGRSHAHFPDYRANAAKKRTYSELVTWMEGQAGKLF